MSTALLRPAATLEAFAEVAGGPGVSLAALEPLTALTVHTCNSRYRILVSQGREILIQGGAFFPEPTAATLEGATLGSSLLKLGWIGIGFRMEIHADGRRIVTSAVRSIGRDEVAGSARPH
jgi:hypothetical protein